MSTKTTDARRRIGPLVYLLLVVIVVAGALWWSARRDTGGPPADAVLLDQYAPLRSDGAELAFTVRRPSKIKITVTLPEGLKGTVRFGVPRASKAREMAYAPMKERELTFTVDGRMDAPFERDVMAVGSYIIRVDPIPVAMGVGAMQVHARVKAEPIIRR